MSTKKYTIKPLEWVQEDFRTWNAISGDAFYTAFLSSGDRWKVYFKGSAIGDSETLEDAQKVVETHRDKLLLLQLEPATALQSTQYLLTKHEYVGTILISQTDNGKWICATPGAALD